jgi:hypothetical protein
LTLQSAAVSFDILGALRLSHEENLGPSDHYTDH